MSDIRTIINWKHVEYVKQTSDTTVYVHYVSGEGVVYEFQLPEQAQAMIRSFDASGNGHFIY